MRSQESDKAQAVKKLQQDLQNSPLHCFGCHSNCSPDYCKTIQQQQQQQQQQHQQQHQHSSSEVNSAGTTSMDNNEEDTTTNDTIDDFTSGKTSETKHKCIRLLQI